LSGRSGRLFAALEIAQHLLERPVDGKGPDIESVNARPATQ